MTAPGVTRLDEFTYDTTFVTAWWWLAYALVPAAAILAWRARASELAYVAIGTVLLVPHYVVAAIVVAQYRRSGWSDGLEVLAFVHPVGLSVLAVVVLVLTGAIDGSSRRRRLHRQQQPA